MCKFCHSVEFSCGKFLKIYVPCITDNDDDNDSKNDGAEVSRRPKWKTLLGKRQKGNFSHAGALIAQKCKHKSLTFTLTVSLQVLMVRRVRRERMIQERAAKSLNQKQARVFNACYVKMYISINACVLHNIAIVPLWLLVHKDLLAGIHVEGLFK